jgi:hypothetical protein
MSSFSAEAITARLLETPTARSQRELAELGRAPNLATPKHLRAYEACEEFVRKRAAAGIATTDAERETYLGAFEAGKDDA